jgi:hypothetical protein
MLFTSEKRFKGYYSLQLKRLFLSLRWRYLGNQPGTKHLKEFGQYWVSGNSCGS